LIAVALAAAVNVVLFYGQLGVSLQTAGGFDSSAPADMVLSRVILLTAVPALIAVFIAVLLKRNRQG
jgi:hypothetical protein